MEPLYEVWLHTVCDFDPELSAKALPVIEKRGVKFSSSELELMMLREIGISGEFAKRFTEPEFFKKAIEIIEYCKENGIRIITRDSEEYPQYLLNIDTPPRILFAKGEELKLNDVMAVSVVGTRKPSDQGRVAARGIGKRLAQNGIVTVSGMAEGIDAEAHWGALEGGGKTVAVLAGSTDTIYPKCNTKLYHEIIKNGTVLSERPPGTVAKRYFYQQRNRIIVGLSRGTVFVEGRERSGTSMTARLALENNRDLFALPGSPLNWQSELPNRMISEGAIVVNKLELPAEYYKEQNPELFRELSITQDVPRANEEFLSDDEKILNFLNEKGGSVRLEEMSEALGIAVNVLTGRLTVLCIKGRIRQESGNRYISVK